MKNKSWAALAIGLLLIGVASAPARGDSVVFNNLGPGQSYNGGTGWTIGAINGGADYLTDGMGFTVGATSVNLSTIQVAVGTVIGANQLTIDLDADAGGAPGATLESWTINNAMPPFGVNSSDNLVVATSVLHPLLAAGTQYWVVVSVPQDGSSSAAWNWNSIGDLGPFLQTDNGSGTPFTNTRGAMLITGLIASVPEPSSFVLASTAAAVFLGCGLRRRGRTKAG